MVKSEHPDVVVFSGHPVVKGPPAFWSDETYRILKGEKR